MLKSLFTLTNEAPSRKSLFLLQAAFLILLALATFYPSFSNGFVNMDDNIMLYNNPRVMVLSLSNTIDYFTSFHAKLYQPLVNLSYAVEFHFFKFQPVGYHVVSLCLHICNLLLVYYLFFLLTGNMLPAFIVACLFAIHPLHVESVAWISERKDMLYSLFYLLASACYVLFRQSPRKQYYILSLAFFICSLMSKAMAVTLPVALIVFDFMLGDNFSKKQVKNKIPFFALAAIFSILAVYGQGSFTQKDNLTALEIIKNALEAIYNMVFYLAKTLYPANLSIVYPKYIEAGKLIHNYLLYSPPMLALIIAAIIFSTKYTRKVVLGFSFYVITLAPAANFIPFGLGMPGDRYSYIPLLGLFYVMAEVFVYLYHVARAKRRVLGKFLICCMVAWLVALAVSAHNRAKIWRNSFRLYSNVIANYGYSRYSRFSYTILGSIYLSVDDIVSAEKYAEMAFKLEPESCDVYILRGIIAQKIGRLDDALNQFNMAKQLNTRNNVLPTICIADIYLSRKMYNKAIKSYDLFLSRNTNSNDYANNIPPALIKRAQVFYKLKEYSNAIADCAEAIRLDPLSSDAYILRGLCHKHLGDTASYLRDKQKCREISCFSPNIHIGAVVRYSSEQERLWNELDVIGRN